MKNPRGYLLVRVYFTEEEEYLIRRLLKNLMDKGISGMTLLKGILGYGQEGKFHYEGVETLSYDLPVIMEFVEDEDKALSVLEELKNLLKGRLITLEKVSLC
ncbi:DUF190 domain-containing protein [Thermocrinis minervae]|uniref:Uncharacterized protein n=1 Tax=Thermocrinis minervae TaxID=381751 RepID=A0A1M6SQT8_9AQUI|nr:DUF190 domain-containing protein [Thermocrinis minervae]SHK47114.1 hypothetical protein SAMN05444391_1130 [Thermocrinis minervae]